MEHPFRLTHAEHLKGKVCTEILFKIGKTFLVFPFLVHYYMDVTYSGTPVRLVFSAPKRRLRHAVDRNRIKRLTREAYRQNKQLLVSAVPESSTLYVSFSYVTDKLVSYKVIELAIVKCLNRLSASL